MIMSENTTTEGLAPFREYETWYRITGDVHSEVTPLVVVHGGPGMLARLPRLARGPGA